MGIQWSKQEVLFWHLRLRCGLLSITTPVLFLDNEFDVESVFHGQVNLAAVNQIYVFFEAMNVTKIYTFIRGLL